MTITWAEVERLARDPRPDVRAAAKAIVTKFNSDMCPERGSHVHLWYEDRGKAFRKLELALGATREGPW